jgi:Ca-activated chloride channel family protein
MSAFPRERGPLPNIKTNVNLVLVDVTVTDREGRVVNGLKARDFSVLDEKREQKVRYFSTEDAPISVAVLIDSSSSMWRNFDHVRSAALDFFRESNPQDEFAIISFAVTPTVVIDFSDHIDELQPVLWSIEPKGYTALSDAIYWGANYVRRGRYAKKALLLISDGGENHSRYTQSEVRKMLEEADVQLYAIDIFKAYPKTVEERSGLVWLDEMTTASGGRTFLVHDAAEIRAAVKQISTELRNQYVLGFVPESLDRGNKWHKLKVKLNPATESNLHVYAKKGYYAPVQ